MNVLVILARILKKNYYEFSFLPLSFCKALIKIKVDAMYSCLSGGLGNQMFQYAAAYILQRKLKQRSLVLD